MPYVLPAPIPKDESLPALPPPGSPSSLPALPPPSSVSAPAPPSSPSPTGTAEAAAGADDAPAATKDVKATGFVLQLGSGVLAPTSSFARGMRTIGPGITFALGVGVYATPHVGVLVGFRGSYGHKLAGCSDGCRAGYSLQLPVMVQLAHKDRARGLYGEVGFGLATTYGGSGDGYTYSLSSPVELKFGVGYRLSGANHTRNSRTLDLNVGMDVGEVQRIKVTTDSASYAGAIDGAEAHVVVALSLISHFSL